MALSTGDGSGSACDIFALWKLIVGNMTAILFCLVSYQLPDF